MFAFSVVLTLQPMSAVPLTELDALSLAVLQAIALRRLGGVACGFCRTHLGTRGTP